MRASILKTTTLILLSLLSCSVYAYPEVSHRFVFYDIYPGINKNLKVAINERTPIVEGGRKFHGRTDWYVRWNFRWKKKNGRCRITSVRTTLDVKYTMPRIPNSYDVPTDIRYAFGKYYALLFEHEKGHKKTGLLAAERIEEALLSLGYFSSCKKLEKTANKKGRDLIKLYNKRDEAYDNKTDHGRRDGVNINNFIVD